MLILTRKPGESIYIGDGIKVVIVEIKGNQIRVGIDAPAEVRIYREEIYLQILEENKKAAEAAAGSESGLEGLSGTWKGVPGAKATTGTSTLFGSSMKTMKGPAAAPGGTGPVVVKRKKGPKADDE